MRLVRSDGTSQRRREEGEEGERIHTFEDGVPAALLAGDDDIDDALLDAFAAAAADGAAAGEARHANLPVLPAFGKALYVAVAVQHVEQAIGRVQALVLGFELAEHIVISGRVEGVDVWLVDRRSRQPHGRASAKRDYGIFGER